ncbi:MAG: hypothetical protein ACLRI7_15585 [Ruthenibacterium lactatiformans]
MFAIQFLNGKRIVESANILNLQPYYDAAPEAQKRPECRRHEGFDDESGRNLLGLPFTANCQLYTAI